MLLCKCTNLCTMYVACLQWKFSVLQRWVRLSILIPLVYSNGWSMMVRYVCTGDDARKGHTEKKCLRKVFWNSLKLSATTAWRRRPDDDDLTTTAWRRRPDNYNIQVRWLEEPNDLGPMSMVWQYGLTTTSWWRQLDDDGNVVVKKWLPIFNTWGKVKDVSTKKVLTLYQSILLSCFTCAYLFDFLSWIGGNVKVSLKKREKIFYCR